LNQSFVSALDERIAKRLPGGGGYYTKAMPLDPAIGFAMVVLLFLDTLEYYFYYPFLCRMRDVEHEGDKLSPN
jgi:hypothetical protein